MYLSTTAFTLRVQRFIETFRLPLLAIFWTVALGVSARFVEPIIPIPFTFQTFLIFMMVWVHRATPSVAIVSVSSYLMAGALGAPVFALGQGFFYMLGTTGGFLAGFLVATVAMARIAKLLDEPSIMEMIFVSLFGLIIIYIMGVGWYNLLEPDTKLWALFWPYIFGDLVKTVVAITILRLSGIVKRPMP